ncbi:MAG: ATP-binding protein [Bacteroidales bacterium]|nr:ATP-binding protein [Bacteroidales bacterium]
MKDLSMHILDIAQNSITADASLIQIAIHEDMEKNSYEIVIADDGKGMTKEICDRVTDPYFTTRTTRKVGIGLSLLRQNAEQTGGHIDIHSEPGKGTKVRSIFTYDHIDRPALGDISGTIITLVAANPEIDLIYTHTAQNGKYCFDTREIKAALEDMKISNPKIRQYLHEMIEENLTEINPDQPVDGSKYI